MQKHCIKSSSNICFGYLLESPERGDSNKYLKHMFYEEIRMKQGFSYISLFGNKCFRCNEGSLYLTWDPCHLELCKSRDLFIIWAAPCKTKQKKKKKKMIDGLHIFPQKKKKTTVITLHGQTHYFFQYRTYPEIWIRHITKTRLFKYIENFTTKNWKFSDKKFWYFSYFCSKHILWVRVRTASARRF